MKLIPKLTLLSKEHWTYDPFSAHKTENGDIYARGTQVCKLHLTKIINIINKIYKFLLQHVRKILLRKIQIYTVLPPKSFKLSFHH